MPYVVIGGDRVDLEPLGTTHVLRAQGVASAVVRGLCARAGAELLAADEEMGAFVMEGDTTRLAAAIRAAKLTRRARVDPAFRQIDGPPDDLWAPTGRVAVRFPESWTHTRVEQALARHDLRILEPVDGMPGGYFAATAGDPIEAARAILDEGDALFAEPDFIQRMRPTTRATRPPARPRAPRSRA